MALDPAPWGSDNGGRVRIRDGGSTNGTWLGPTRVWDLMIAGAIVLAIGDTELSIKVEASPVHLPLSAAPTFGAAIGESDVMRHLFALLERIDTRALNKRGLEGM